MQRCLKDCRAGEILKLCRIDCPESYGREFFLLGLREGCRLEVLQVKPLFVIKVAYTEIALEESLAASLWGELWRKT